MSAVPQLVTSRRITNWSRARQAHDVRCGQKQHMPGLPLGHYNKVASSDSRKALQLISVEEFRQQQVDEWISSRREPGPPSWASLLGALEAFQDSRLNYRHNPHNGSPSVLQVYYADIVNIMVRVRRSEA